jgi:N-acetylglucosamine malate deacetylase 1
MKLLNMNRVLCISPHPDDVEIGMLGTIMKYTDTTFDILCLTICGAKGFDNSYQDNRLNEVKELWKMAKCSNVSSIRSDCDYFEDKTEPGWINYIERNLLDKVNYDCVFIVPNEDSMFEHRFVSGFGYALIRSKPMSLIEYCTVSTLNTWTANMYIDITELYDRKVELLKCFKSQSNKGYLSEESVEAFGTNFQCCKRNIHKVERFKIKEIIL